VVTKFQQPELETAQASLQRAQEELDSLRQQCKSGTSMASFVTGYRLLIRMRTQ
jgi:hypothetical protein